MISIEGIILILEKNQEKFFKKEVIN